MPASPFFYPDECPPHLFDLEETGAGADVVLPQLVGPVDHGGAARPADPVVVRLPDTSNGRDARLVGCIQKSAME